jgi:hypothetical protein
LVDMHKDGKLRAMAEEEGLKLVYRANFHDFVELMKTDQDASELARQSKVLPPFTKDTFTPDQWEAARLYCVFAFQKVQLTTALAQLGPFLSVCGCVAAWVSCSVA